MIQSKIHTTLKNSRFLTHSSNNYHILQPRKTDTITHSYIKYIMTSIALFYKYKLMLCVSRDIHSAKNREIHYHFNRHTGGFTVFGDTATEDSSLIHIATRRIILYFCQF